MAVNINVQNISGSEGSKTCAFPANFKRGDSNPRTIKSLKELKKYYGDGDNQDYTVAKALLNKGIALSVVNVTTPDDTNSILDFDVVSGGAYVNTTVKTTLNPNITSKMCDDGVTNLVDIPFDQFDKLDSRGIITKVRWVNNGTSNYLGIQCCNYKLVSGYNGILPLHEYTRAGWGEFITMDFDSSSAFAALPFFGLIDAMTLQVTGDSTTISALNFGGTTYNKYVTEYVFSASVGSNSVLAALNSFSTAVISITSDLTASNAANYAIYTTNGTTLKPTTYYVKIAATYIPHQTTSLFIIGGGLSVNNNKELIRNISIIPDIVDGVDRYVPLYTSDNTLVSTDNNTTPATLRIRDIGVSYYVEIAGDFSQLSNAHISYLIENDGTYLSTANLVSSIAYNGTTQKTKITFQKTSVINSRLSLNIASVLISLGAYGLEHSSAVSQFTNGLTLKVLTANNTYVYPTINFSRVYGGKYYYFLSTAIPLTTTQVQTPTSSTDGITFQAIKGNASDLKLMFSNEGYLGYVWVLQNGVVIESSVFTPTITQATVDKINSDLSLVQITDFVENAALSFGVGNFSGTRGVPSIDDYTTALTNFADVPYECFIGKQGINYTTVLPKNNYRPIFIDTAIDDTFNQAIAVSNNYRTNPAIQIVYGKFNGKSLLEYAVTAFFKKQEKNPTIAYTRSEFDNLGKPSSLTQTDYFTEEQVRSLGDNGIVTLYSYTGFGGALRLMNNVTPYFESPLNMHSTACTVAEVTKFLSGLYAEHKDKNLNPTLFQVIGSNLRNYLDKLVGETLQSYEVLDEANTPSLDKLVYNELSDILAGKYTIGVTLKFYNVFKDLTINFVISQ